MNLILLQNIIYWGEPRVDRECFRPGLREMTGPVLTTDKWLEYRHHSDSADRQYRHQADSSDRQYIRPVRWPVSRQTGQTDDIITVDNIHKFVEPPRGPDTFTINVESALNF